MIAGLYPRGRLPPQAPDELPPEPHDQRPRHDDEGADDDELQAEPRRGDHAPERVLELRPQAGVAAHDRVLVGQRELDPADRQTTLGRRRIAPGLLDPHDAGLPDQLYESGD